MRVNEQIRISPVRVINAEGVMLGVMPTSKALEAAREAGLDLVEVAANERPPVCKIIDFGKFKYTQKKKLSKQKQHQVHIKEIRVRPKTGDHDIETKVKVMVVPIKPDIQTVRAVRRLGRVRSSGRRLVRVGCARVVAYQLGRGQR